MLLPLFKYRTNNVNGSIQCVYNLSVINILKHEVPNTGVAREISLDKNRGDIHILPFFICVVT